MLRHLAQKIQRDRVPRPAQHQQHLAPHLHLPGADAEEPDGTVVENLPTHQDIANMINTSRETVTRALLTWSSKASCRRAAPPHHQEAGRAAKAGSGRVTGCNCA
jgi:CRP-like cAMP-binding protein